MAQIIDGKIISQSVKDKVRDEISLLKEKGISVCLAVIIVGDDPASRIYVNNKKKACEYTGIKSVEYALSGDTTQAELIELIKKLNDDKSVTGILCQLPLPKHINPKKIIDAISPKKDVDAFHPVNVGRLMVGDARFLPCTPAGVLEMLDYHNIDITGKKCVVVGRSNIVGKPMAILLLQRNATVTICHSMTENLAHHTREADILVSAVGKAGLITADMVKDGAIVIDVAMNKNDEMKLCGDVDFENVSKKASYITPVPGGVGPMTISTLMKNTLTAARIQNGLV